MVDLLHLQNKIISFIKLCLLLWVLICIWWQELLNLIYELTNSSLSCSKSSAAVGVRMHTWALALWMSQNISVEVT